MNNILSNVIENFKNNINHVCITEIHIQGVYKNTLRKAMWDIKEANIFI